jgi:hypothetical protein
MKMTNELTPLAKRMGKKGGQKTLKKCGRKHYRQMAETRWAKTKREI